MRHRLWTQLTEARHPSGGHFVSEGATIPADATAGYRKGCYFVHTDGSTGTTVYINEGSSSSAAFVPVGTSALLNNVPVIGDSGGVAAGDIVAVTGYDSTTGYRKIKPADANDATLMRDLFYAPNAIAAAATGYVTKGVVVTAQNTSAASAVGDPIFLSATAGAWTLTAPTGAGTRQIEVGSVLVKSASVGVINIDLAGAEAIMGHNHSDAATGGTLSSIAGLTGTTETTFTVNSGGAAAKISLGSNAATGAFTMTLVPANLSGNSVVSFPTGTDTVVTLGASQTLTSKTLTTPTIGDFTNATHTHADAANGGTITIVDIAGTTSNTFEVDNDCATGTLQLKTTTGGADFAVVLTNAITTGLTGDVTVSIPAATTTLVGTGTTQTLTAKTLTAPVINACTITGAVTITTPTVTGTWTNLGTVTTTDINGGTIDGTAIGSSTPAAGAFTTISASDDVTIAAGKDISLAAGAGYIQINAATNGALKILPTGSTAQTVTLSTIAQTVGAATVSIPDMANTNANFVMTETAQTVNGAKTFGSAIIVPAITGSDASLGIDGTAGAGGGAGGIIAIASGGGHTNGAGGALTIAGGLGAGTGAGGVASLTGGQSGAGIAADGGNASLVGGASQAVSGAGDGGDIAITGGACAFTGVGGAVTITSGAGSATGTAGNIAIDVGSAGGGTPGSISIGGTTALTIGIGKSGATTTVTGDLAIAAGDNLTMAAGDGYIQINATTNGALKLQPVTGTAQTVTIATTAAMGQGSAVTIPDPGAATASFVLNKGTNAISSADTHTGTLNISGATVTYRAIAVADCAAAVQDLMPNVTITAGAEAAHARLITFQAKDAAGNNLSERCIIHYWVNATAAYGTPAATGTDTFGAPGVGLILTTLTAKQDYIVQTDASGVCSFTLTHNDAGTNRWITAELNGKLMTSEAIAFDAV